jgi:hypothetical protein
MKSMTITLPLVFLSLLSFQTVTNRTATVEQVNGLYIYWHSRPLDDYTYIDTYQIKIAITGAPDELIQMMINKVKKKYPEANGIIILNDDLSSCDVIKLK